MIQKADPEEFLCKAKSVPVIDVRSPAECRQGQIPGAINLPLFDDRERAQVGTLYKNSGRDIAVHKGFEIAGPKLAGFITKGFKISPKRELLVHCWRGGMRSEHMAWLFDQCGFKMTILQGGYKAYRHYIREQLAGNSPVIILGGMTGSGKTELLHALAEAGEQVLDLERIACHKGSVFGALGQNPQPTNEQFENNIFSEIDGFDLSRPVWIEDESRMIGNVSIPDPLYDRMERARMVKIDIDRKERIRRLVGEYALFGKDDLGMSIRKISERLGGTRTKQAFDQLEEGNFESVADLVLEYYDKSYGFSVAKRICRDIREITLDDGNFRKSAEAVIELMKPDK